jgi:hypothetical protein
MGSKEDKESFWGFKSNITFVLLLLGVMVIGNFLYDNYQSFVRDKKNEQRQEINNSRDNKKKDLESSDKIDPNNLFQEKNSSNINNGEEETKNKTSNDENNATEYDEIKSIKCQWCPKQFKVSKGSTRILGVDIYYWKGGVHSCNERDSKEQANEEKKDVLHTLELAQTHTLSPAKYCSKECACKAYYSK